MLARWRQEALPGVSQARRHRVLASLVGAQHGSRGAGKVNTKGLPRVAKGYARAYYRCKQRGCKRVYYKDFIPYSLSGAIITTACGHGTTLRDNNLIGITRAEFYGRLRRSTAARKGP